MTDIKLAPVGYNHLQDFRGWRNRPETIKHTREYRYLLDSDQNRWWKQLQKDRTQCMFSLMQVSQLQQDVETLVGVGGINHIDWVNRHGEMSLLMANPRDTDLSVDALQSICDYGFDTLNLHRLWVECYTDERVELFIAAGFIREGRKSEAVWQDGYWKDSILLSRVVGR